MSALDNALRSLVRDGWTFDYPRDEHGEIVVGHAARFYPGGWWDGLILRAPHDCTALRVDPDDRQTWRRDGCALDMIHAVRELPAPRERLAPDLASGRRVAGLWVPARR